MCAIMAKQSHAYSLHISEPRQGVCVDVPYTSPVSLTGYTQDTRPLFISSASQTSFPHVRVQHFVRFRDKKEAVET